jgi:hypothetical protein
LSVIEKEIQVWNQVIQGPQKKEVDIDILAFWEKTAPSLPNLAWLARRVLSIPASSTSSERAFSTGGKVVSAARTLLNTNNVESLIIMMKNYEELDPLVEKYVLRKSDFKKLDKARQKEANKDKEKEKEKEKESSSSSSESDDEADDYASDAVQSIHDSDD